MRIMFFVIGLSLGFAGCSKKEEAPTPDPKVEAKKTEDPKAEVTKKDPPPIAVKAQPDGFHSVTAILTVKDVDAAIAWYEKALGAQKRLTIPGPDGKTSMHGEIQLGDSVVMISQMQEGQSHDPESAGGTTGSLNYYVEDVDATFKAAVAAGAKEVMKVEDQFWGDRWGLLSDPFGHAWGIATHKIDVPDEKMAELAKQAMAAMGGKGKKPEIPGTPATSFKGKDMHSITTSLHVKDGNAALAWYKEALGAESRHVMHMPDGSLMHAEIKIGDSYVMLSQENKEYKTTSPASLGGKTPISLYVYTADVDGAFAKAVGAKAEVRMPVTDMFWGDRMGVVGDNSGHHWGLATHKYDYTPEQMQAKMAEQFGGGDKPEAAEKKDDAPAAAKPMDK